MGMFATDHIRARISRARVAEMRARGWRVVGPAEEGMLMMEGPDPDLTPLPEEEPDAVGSLFLTLAARAGVVTRHRVAKAA